MAKRADLWKFRVKTFIKFRELFQQLTMRDIKLKYRGSYIGYIWSVLNPLLTMLVLVAVFGTLFSRTIANFPAYLICGQVIFGFMTDSTNSAMSSITGNAALLLKTYVPKYIFTLSSVTSTLVTMLLSLGAVIIVFVFTGTAFSPVMLLFFIPIVQVYFFSLGLGFFLAQATVFFKDIKFIYSVICTAWFYLSAIMYDVSILPEWLRPIIVNYNPMYTYITAFRNVMYQETVMSFELFWRGWLWAAAFMAFGLFFFVRNKDKFVLHL